MECAASFAGWLDRAAEHSPGEIDAMLEHTRLRVRLLEAVRDALAGRGGDPRALPAAPGPKAAKGRRRRSQTPSWRAAHGAKPAVSGAMLDLLADTLRERGPLGPTDLARAASVSKATVHGADGHPWFDRPDGLRFELTPLCLAERFGGGNGAAAPAAGTP